MVMCGHEWLFPDVIAMLSSGHSNKAVLSYVHVVAVISNLAGMLVGRTFSLHRCPMQTRGAGNQVQCSSQLLQDVLKHESMHMWVESAAGWAASVDCADMCWSPMMPLDG